MKKYFAIAFILLVVLLLVLRKQTEPEKFSSPRAATETPTPTATATPAGAAVPSAAEPKASTTAVQSAPTVGSTNTLTPEQLQQFRSMIKNSAASGYVAQRAAQAEWDRFTSDLVYIGWEPPSTELAFKMGFLSAFDGPRFDEKEKPERFSTDAFINEEKDESSQKIRYTPAAEKIRLSDYARYCEHGCVATKDSFEMLLVAPLDDQGHVDVWTINDKKEIKQVVDGTAAH